MALTVEEAITALLTKGVPTIGPIKAVFDGIADIPKESRVPSTYMNGVADILRLAGPFADELDVQRKD